MNLDVTNAARYNMCDFSKCVNTLGSIPTMHAIHKANVAVEESELSLIVLFNEHPFICVIKRHWLSWAINPPIKNA